MNMKKFKKEHRMFITVGTIFLIAAAAAIVWKFASKLCCCPDGETDK